MKKSTRITYIWHRLLMTVVFVIGLLGLLLNDDQSAKSEYLFISAQSGMFLIVSFVPTFCKKLRLDIPDFVYIFFILFCLAHFFFGEILGFFVKVKWWDSVMHTFSGMMIALLSFSLINILNNNVGNFKLNMGFAILFAFSMSVMIGVVWEIIEFAADSWFGLNMQRAYVSTMDGRGAALVGQAALKDTMKDLILDSIGAGFVCVVCAIFAHKKKIKVEDLSFIKRSAKVVVPASADVKKEDVDVLMYDAEVEEKRTQENLQKMKEDSEKKENSENEEQSSDSLEIDSNENLAKQKEINKKKQTKTKSNSLKLKKK